MQERGGQGLMAVSPHAKVEACGALIHMRNASGPRDDAHRHAALQAKPHHSLEDGILSYLAPRRLQMVVAAPGENTADLHALTYRRLRPGVMIL